MTYFKRTINILMAEDNPEHRHLALEALKVTNLSAELQTVQDGEELIDYLYRRGEYENPEHSPRPQIILLDLDMPKKNGLSALHEIKADSNLRLIPVIILTNSNAQTDIKQAYELGASSFINKPVTFEGFVEVMLTLNNYWFDVVQLPPNGTSL